MANRNATASDVSTYAAITDGLMQENDIIYDTLTGTGVIFYNDISTNALFTGARTNPTVWVNTAISGLRRVSISNSANSSKYTAKGTFTIRALHTDSNPLQLSRDASASNPIFIQDIDYVVDGEISSHTGMKWGLGNFPRDNFGIILDAEDDKTDQNNMIFKNPISSDGVSSCTGIVRGVYFKHGYNTLRAFDSEVDIDNTLTVERCFFDIGASEGTYLGITNAGAAGHPRTLHTIQDCIIFARGSESLQMQHLLNNSVVRNVTIFAGGSKFRDSFLSNQDSGIQIMPLESCTLEKVIVDGFGENGLIVFGDSGNGTPGTFTANRLLLNQGRNKGVYFHPTTSGGVTHEIRNLYAINFNNTIEESNFNTLDDYVLENAGTDTVNVLGLTKDSSKTNYLQAAVDESHGLSVDGTLSPPSYIKSGFSEVAEKLEIFATAYPFWSGWYGDVTAAASSDAGTTTTLTIDSNPDLITGDITTISGTTSYNGIHQITVISATEIKIPVAFVATETGNYAKNIERTEGDICLDLNDFFYYKCNGDYVPTTADTPKDDATNWTLLQWDSEGVRSDEAGYDSGSARNDPPLNFGLVKNTLWNKLGMGCYNEENDDYIIFRWYVADDASGTNSNQIPNATEYKLDTTRFTQAESGKYLRLGVKDVGKQEVVTDWTLIP